MQSEIAAGQAQHSRSLADGDFDEVAKATARIASAEAQRVLLENQRQAIERMPVSTGDPVEDFCAGRTEPTARWLRANPEWVTDPRKNAKLTGAHHLAIGEGLEPDTPAYFAKVEEVIGLRGNSGNSRGGGSRVSMNVNRNDVSTHISDNGRQVFLTRGEKERATDGTLIWNYGPNKGKPIGVAEMARRKIELNKQQMYTRLG